MCIVVKVELKAALLICAIGALSVGTYYLTNQIKQNQSELQDNVEITCTLITSVLTDDGFWHNIWQYIYNNLTYTMTTTSIDEPETHTCCLNIDNPNQITDCPKNQIVAMAAVIGGAWSAFLCMSFIYYRMFRSKKMQSLPI